MSHSNGEYGGRVLRGFKGDGTQFIQGAILTPDMVAHWPVGNRRALHKDGKVDWFGPPSEDEQEVRDAGKEVEEKKETKPPLVRTRNAPKPASEKAPEPVKEQPKRATVAPKGRTRSRK